MQLTHMVTFLYQIKVIFLKQMGLLLEHEIFTLPHVFVKLSPIGVDNYTPQGSMCQQFLGGVEMLLYMSGISKKNLVHRTLSSWDVCPHPQWVPTSATLVVVSLSSCYI